MKLINGVIIGNSNYIGKSLNGLIKEVKLKGKPYSISSRKYCINKGDRKYHWIGHSDLKELDIIDFFKRKQTIEYMEA